MSSHSFICIGYSWLLAFREGYFPELGSLFRERDRTYTDTGLFAGYEVSVSQMRDRMNLIGIDMVQTRNAFHKTWRDLSEEERADSFDFDAWLERLCLELETSGSADIHQDDDWINWHVEPRFVVRAFVEIYKDRDETVFWNLIDLTSRGFLDPSAEVCTKSRNEVHDTLRSTLPVIVLTEGSTDAEFLTGAIEVLRPHLIGFVTMMDFGHSVEGGAAALIRTLKAFIASGVPNRVVALFDNDTAAADVIASNKSELPHNYRILQYPALELASDYPTLGPSGLTNMDVNGAAGSLELYLGRDILTRPDGSLTPIQWTGYNQKLKRYQGGLTDKALLQKRFRGRLKSARSNGPTEGEDWSGLEVILDGICHVFD